MIVVDTNVVSELMRSDPDERVVAWVTGIDGRDLFTTAITLGEIGFGLERLPDGARKRRLVGIADQVFTAFHDRVLAFDAAAAQRYGGVVASRERSGHPISIADAQIAAICLCHDATLATRNTDDFAMPALDVVDPWAT